MRVLERLPANELFVDMARVARFGLFEAKKKYLAFLILKNFGPLNFGEFLKAEFGIFQLQAPGNPGHGLVYKVYSSEGRLFL